MSSNTQVYILYSKSSGSIILVSKVFGQCAHGLVWTTRPMCCFWACLHHRGLLKYLGNISLFYNWTILDYRNLCDIWTYLPQTTGACSAPGLVYTTEACAAPQGMNCTWTYLDNKSLCYIWTYQDYRGLPIHYRGLCCTWTCPRNRGLSYTWTYLDNVQEGKRHKKKETSSCFCLCSSVFGEKFPTAEF